MQETEYGYTSYQDVVLLAVRLITGAIFLYAGYAKLPFWSATPPGMSEGMANLTKFLSIVEPLGALAILLGFLTRWAAGGLSIIMVGAIFYLQFVMHIGFATPTGPGWNFPLMVLAGCLVLLTFGPGRWSAKANKGQAH
jgi:putative oxidoreductase